MFCSQCRAKNTNDAKFCQQCGTRLGTMSLNESTVLSSPPVYVATHASTSSGNAYLSLEPGIPPPPPPDVLAVGRTTPYEQRPPLQTRRQKSRRRRWILLSCLGVILLILIAVGSYMYSNRSTPMKTLDTVCNAYKTSNYPTVYNQYSSNYQNQIGGEAHWEAATKQGFSRQGGLVNCTYYNVIVNGSTGSDVMSLSFGSGYGAVETFQQTLVVENGVWKINSSTPLP
jgi:hypothetical protein